MTPRRWAAGLATAAVLAAGLAGCGSDETPLEQEPALADALAEVDAAAVADDDARLEEAVAGLVQVTDDAEESGDLDADDADRIRGAAEALLEAAGAKPEPEPAESSTTSEAPAEPETTTSSPAPPSEEDDDADEDGEGGGSDKGSKPPKGKKGPKKKP